MTDVLTGNSDIHLLLNTHLLIGYYEIKIIGSNNKIISNKNKSYVKWVVLILDHKHQAADKLDIAYVQLVLCPAWLLWKSAFTTIPQTARIEAI